MSIEFGRFSFSQTQPTQCNYSLSGTILDFGRIGRVKSAKTLSTVISLPIPQTLPMSRVGPKSNI